MRDIELDAYARANDALRARVAELEAVPEYVNTQNDIEIASLRAEVSQLTNLLDNQQGTPCEQIRHQQEVEALRARVAELEEALEKIQASPYRDIGALMNIARAALTGTVSKPASD